MCKTCEVRLFFISIFFVPLVAFSQSFRPPINNYSPKDYGSKSNPENWCVTQDSRGIIYVGNYNGILEYDGHTWNFIVVKPGANVVSLATDSSSTIFVGSVGEFGFLEANEQGELLYRSLSDSLPDEISKFGVVWKTYATKDAVYFQAEEHLYIYDYETVSAITPEDSYHTSFLCNNEFYVRERGVGIRQLVDGKLETLNGTEFLAERGVFGILPYNGDLLIVTQEEGFWVYNESGFSSVGDWAWFDLANTGIVGAIQLSNGNYAVNTLLAGVVILDRDLEIIEFINKEKGIRSDDVKAVFEDRDQNLWFALQNGISKVIYNSPLSYYQENAGLEGGVEAVYRLGNNLLVGTSSGLFISGWRWSGRADFVAIPDVQSQVWAIKVVENNLYIGASDGLYHAPLLFTDNGTPMVIREEGQTTFQRLVEFNTNAIAYVPNYNYLILAGSSGIVLFDHATLTPFQYEQAQFSRVSSIAIDPEIRNGYIEGWVGTQGSGTIRLQIDDFGFMTDIFTSGDGLEDEWVRPLLFDDEVVFATNRGVQHFVHEDEVIESLPDSLKNDPAYARGYFDAFLLHDSVFSVPVTYVINDTDRFWACIDNQVSFFSKVDEKWHHRPFWGIDFNRINTLYEEEDGTLWIGAADGLIRYHHSSTKDYQSSYNALIRSVWVGDSVLYHGNFYRVGMQDEPLYQLIDYKNNSIHFYFAAPYFEDDQKIQYSWMLEGLDEHWSEWTITHDFPYSNLHEGEYIFKVRARNIYGNISQPAEYYFIVAPPWYRTTWAYIGYALVLIVIVYIAIRISAYKLKKQNQWLEQVVAERTAEIAMQNVELEHQRDEIMEQKEEITDSINYAERIQRAILPPARMVKENLPDSFIHFKPKDIVSGDFYWMERRDNKIFFAAADCTGHGVPGAMVSVVCSNALNRTVKEFGITETGKILDKTTDLVIETFEKSDEDVKDGMDIALCCLDADNGSVWYSGANNPLWIVTQSNSSTAKELGEPNIQSEDEQLSLYEVKATKQPVGKYAARKEFETNSVKLNKGDIMYLFSDGYADQFGGDRGKKYKYRPFKRFLLSIYELTIPEQHQKLDEEFAQWQGDFEQVDDVVVIGVKL